MAIVPAAFGKVTFPFNLYLLALVASGLSVILTMPLWRAWAIRSGLVDDPGHRKIHATPVPLAGGLAVLTGVLVPLVGGWVLLQIGFVELAAAEQLDYGFRRRALQLLILVAGAAAMFALGWLDDKHELRPAIKFAGQLLIAFAVAATGIRITLFVPNTLFSFAITVLWILTVTNAFNFMDNMNGLCGGLGAIGTWYFGLSAMAQGQYLVALLAWLACGALLGFLPFNFPKATVFLGDSGSHLVGYLLAVLAVLPNFYSAARPNIWAVFAPLCILAVPLADLVWVVLIRWHLGKPFYIGDTNHLSHRLVRRGWSRSHAVLWIWLAAALLGAIPFI